MWLYYFYIERHGKSDKSYELQPTAVRARVNTRRCSTTFGESRASAETLGFAFPTVSNRDNKLCK